MADEQFDMILGVLGLIVQRNGGVVEIPFADLESGLKGSVKIDPDYEKELLVVSIVEQ